MRKYKKIYALLSIMLVMQLCLGSMSAMADTSPSSTSNPLGLSGIDEPELPPPPEEQVELDPTQWQVRPTDRRVRAATSDYFGDGSDGDLHIAAGQTVTLPVEVPHQTVVQKYYRNITIEAGGVLTTSAPNAGLVIKATGTVTINGTIDQSAKAPKTNPYNNYPYPPELVCGAGGTGGNVRYMGSGSNPGTAVGGTGMLGRPYGGGYSGGGAGGLGSRASLAAKGGDAGSASDIVVSISNIFAGGWGNSAPGLYGGGGAGSIGDNSVGKAGGSNPGGAGVASSTAYVYEGGGGGGAGNMGGGVVLIYVRGDFNLLGQINCSGGNGGNGGSVARNSGAGGGGAGGGGIYVSYGGSLNHLGAINVGGGVGGNAGGHGSGTDVGSGTSGTAGTFTVQKAPDSTPPVISNVSVTSTWSATNVATITATDDKTGVAEYAITTTNTAPASGWQAGNSFTISTNGQYYAWAMDGLGNVSLGKAFAVSRVDNSKPVISAVNVPPTLVQGGNVATVVASDVGSGIAGYAMTTTSAAPSGGWQPSNSFSVSANGSYYFWVKDNINLISAGYLLSVTKIPYSVTVSPSAHGVVIPSVSPTAIAGDTVILDVRPDTGYRLKAGTLKVNGAVVSGSSFVMPSANVTITAEFEIVRYNITVLPTEHGSVAADKVTATYGERVELSISIDLGYKLKVGSLRVNGAAIAGTSFSMPAENVTVTAAFEPSIFEIIVAPMERAVVTADKATATVGETVMVTVAPHAGYQLKAGTLKVNGNEIVSNQFMMPASVATITAEFEPIEYAITVASTEHGTVVADKSTAILGELVRLTVTADEGYSLIAGSVKVNGVSITGTSFAMENQNAVVSAEFEPITYSVITRSTPNGYIEASKEYATIGERITVTVTPIAGYQLVTGSLKVNGSPIVDDSFAMPAATAIITAAFEPVEYTVTVADTPNGTVTTDKSTATIGETVKITATPELGYKLIAGSIKVNGRTSGTSFVMGAANAMVSAQFEPIVYTVRLVQSPNGTITTDKSNAIVGNTVKLTISPDRGYQLKAGSLKVDGKPINGNSFVLGAANATVTVEFEPIEYTITVAQTQNGTVVPNKTKAIIGEEVRLTITPEVGYRLVAGSIKVNGKTAEAIFVMDAQNTVVSAEFEPITYNLTLQQTPNGTITADRQTAVIGDTVTITARPDSGYRLVADSLKVNGIAITDNSFVMTAANALVRAEFEAITVLGSVCDTESNHLSGMTITIRNDELEMMTATNREGKYTFVAVPNGSYTLTAQHYRWDTATVQIAVENDYVTEPAKLDIICTRDNRLFELEELIRSLPEPLEDNSNDPLIKECGADIRRAKTLYDELPTGMRPQLDADLKTKLDKLLIRLAELEGRVESNIEGVQAEGLEGVVDKSQIVSVDGDPTDKITVLLSVEATDKPAAMDKQAIEDIADRQKRVSGYMDVNLLLQVDDKQPTNFSTIPKPITVRLPVPKEIQGSDYSIMRVHNGVAEHLDTVLDDKVLVFETDRFSTYAIEYKPYSGGGGGGTSGIPPVIEPTPKPTLPPPANLPTVTLPETTTPIVEAPKTESISPTPPSIAVPLPPLPTTHGDNGNPLSVLSSPMFLLSLMLVLLVVSNMATYRLATRQNGTGVAVIPALTDTADDVDEGNALWDDDESDTYTDEQLPVYEPEPQQADDELTDLAQSPEVAELILSFDNDDSNLVGELEDDLQLNDFDDDLVLIGESVNPLILDEHNAVTCSACTRSDEFPTGIANTTDTPEQFFIRCGWVQVGVESLCPLCAKKHRDMDMSVPKTITIPFDTL